MSRIPSSRPFFLGLVLSVLALLPGAAHAVRNPYAYTLATTYDSQQGTQLVTGPNAQPQGAVGYFEAGDWLRFAAMDFGPNGASSFQLGVAVQDSNAGRQFELRLDRPTGQLIGTLTLSGTGSWTSFTTQYGSAVSVAGVHDVYVVAKGSGYVGNIASLMFIQSGVSHTRNPYDLRGIWARDSNDQSGTTLVTVGTNVVVDSFDSGDWLQFSGLDFGATGARTVYLGAAVDDLSAGNTLQLRLGSPTGQLIGSVTLAGTGGWERFTTHIATITPVPGIHDLYLVGAGTGRVARISGFQFVRAQ